MVKLRQIYSGYCECTVQRVFVSTRVLPSRWVRGGEALCGIASARAAGIAPQSTTFRFFIFKYLFIDIFVQSSQIKTILFRFFELNKQVN